MDQTMDRMTNRRRQHLGKYSPWCGDYNEEEMRSILDFEHKKRQSPLLKELLGMPCMCQQSDTAERTDDTERRKREHRDLQSNYTSLAQASVPEKLELKRLQESALETNTAEDHVDTVKTPSRRIRGKQGAVASFAKDGLYEKPSAFIRVLLAELPAEAKLTQGQTLFMVKFAEACDQAWADEKKMPEDRKPYHMLLLGAGGTGKTHVVQKLIFKAVEYIWPNESQDSPSMLVVASSNAQAKNISTAEWKARTLHNAASMRVQNDQRENAPWRQGASAGEVVAKRQGTRH